MKQLSCFCYLLLIVLSGCTTSTTRRANDLDNLKIPKISISLTPKSMDLLSFQTTGHISPCTKPGQTEKLFLPPGVTLSVSNHGVKLQPDSRNEISVLCETSGTQLDFEGSVTLKPGMCEATGDEIYCRPKSYPNPEIFADRIQYDVSFVLPPGFSALTPYASVALNNGMLFQLAKFQTPIFKKSKHISIEYLLPQNFNTDGSKYAFIENTIDAYFDSFGSLPFDSIRIGAIRRGEKSGEIAGSPGGNVILFSRSALGAPVTIRGMEQLGITRDISEALRRMIIAHELSHFWFSDRFLGKDGWMVEGIPNYLGLTAVKNTLAEDFPELLKMFIALDKKGQQTPIPNHPFGDGDNYLKAYYQGPLALYRIGESIGHDSLIRLIADVYKQNADPDFAAFETIFLKRFASHQTVWRTAWRL